MFREFGFAFCVSEVFLMFFESCVEVSVGSSNIKFVAVGACQFNFTVDCQLPKPGDRRNYKICWKFRVNDERPTGKKNTTIEWDDGGKIGDTNKLILTEIFPWVHETWYLKVLILLC